MEKISIILPTYNEEEAILETINQLKIIIQGQQKFNFEIIAVNDGSTDKTKEILDKIQGIIIINHHLNKGYGASLKTGIKKADGEWILITDADESYPLENIPEFINYTNTHDLISGARVGTYRPFYGRPAKVFLSKLASYLTGFKIPDLNCGLRLFKKECALKFFHLLPDKFSFTSTHLMAALTNGYNIKFIPIKYNKRKGKSSLRPFKSFFEFLILIIRMVVYFNPLKVFIPLSAALLAASAITLFYSIIFMEKVLDATVIILFITSIQILSIGMVADLIVKNRKL